MKRYRATKKQRRYLLSLMTNSDRWGKPGKLNRKGKKFFNRVTRDFTATSALLDELGGCDI